MRKQLIVACLALAAFAVVPALASAKPVLTHPTGTVAAVGTKITGTNIGNSVLSNGLGTVTCSTAILTGSLTANTTAGGIDGTITSAKFGGTTGKTIAGQEEPECTGSGFYSGGAGVTATPNYCLEATENNDNLKVRGGACTEGEKNVVFHLTVTTIFGNVTCTYQKTALTGTFSTHPEDVVGTLSEQEFTKAVTSGGECPATGKLTVKFTLETDSATTEPVYISS